MVLHFFQTLFLLNKLFPVIFYYTTFPILNFSLFSLFSPSLNLPLHSFLLPFPLPSPLLPLSFSLHSLSPSLLPLFSLSSPSLLPLFSLFSPSLLLLFSISSPSLLPLLSLHSPSLLTPFSLPSPSLPPLFSFSQTFKLKFANLEHSSIPLHRHNLSLNFSICKLNSGILMKNL